MSTRVRIRERTLKNMLYEKPALLGLSEPVAVVRELRVPWVGRVDLIAVSVSGNIMLIECKMADNPEIGKGVVGQIFAYAAGLSGTDYITFDLRFKDSEDEVERSLTAAVKDAAVKENVNLADDWEEAFQGVVRTNLENGRFDLVIAVDWKPPKLTRVVDFLNERSTLKIRVLSFERELKAAVGPVDIVPEFLFGALARQSREGEAFIRRLYNQAVEHGRVDWVAGASPSLTARLNVGTVRAAVWRCNVQPPASWDLLFGRMRRQGVSPDRMQRLLGQLQSVPDIGGQFEGAAVAWHKRSIPLDLLVGRETSAAVVDALQDFLDM